MAAGNWIPYTQAVVNTMKGAIDWTSANIRCVLLSTGYTPAQDTDATWTNVSGSQISGTGYTAGGVAVSGNTVTNSGGTTTAATATAMQWTSSTLTAKYAALVLSTGGATPNTTDKLLAYLALDTSTTVSTTSGTLSISGYSVAITHNAS